MLPRRNRLRGTSHGVTKRVGGLGAGPVDIGADPFEQLDRREALLAPGGGGEQVEWAGVDGERPAAAGRSSSCGRTHTLREQVAGSAGGELGGQERRRIPAERGTGGVERASRRAEAPWLQPELVAEPASSGPLPRHLDPSEGVSRVSQQVGVARQRVAEARDSPRRAGHQPIRRVTVCEVRQRAHGGPPIAAT